MASALSRVVSTVFRSTRSAGLALIILFAIGLGSLGIRQEGYVSLQGDMPRYLTNGAYLLDVLKDRPFGSVSEFLDYSRLYYARYPALSLGHHPLLLPFLEVPAFAIGGVSVASARVVILVSFLAAAAFLYLLVWEIYGSTIAALLASGLFVTNTWILTFAHSVLSEMPTLALIIAAAYFARRFADEDRRWSLPAFAACAVLALYAKQLALFSLLGFAVFVLMRRSLRSLARPDVVRTVIVTIIAVAPLVPVTFVLSHGNVAAVVSTVRGESNPGELMLGAVARVVSVIRAQFSLPVLLLVVGSVAVAATRRDRRVALPVLWSACALAVLLLTGPMEPERYTVYIIPALCMLAGYAAAAWPRPPISAAAAAIVGLALAWQVATAKAYPLPGADGYEEAAEFVVNSDPGASVLFSGDVDTGFFTFFVRKHDVGRQLVVLRADKLFTTSFMTHTSGQDRIKSPEEIYDILHRFGTKYVVMEDRPSEAKVLEWLRHELRSSRFVERKRIPLGTSDRRLRGTSLAIFEFLDCTPPDRTAVFTVHIPLIGRSVSVPFSDLLDRKYLR